MDSFFEEQYVSYSRPLYMTDLCQHLLLLWWSVSSVFWWFLLYFTEWWCWACLKNFLRSVCLWINECLQIFSLSITLFYFSLPFCCWVLSSLALYICGFKNIFTYSKSCLYTVYCGVWMTKVFSFENIRFICCFCYLKFKSQCLIHSYKISSSVH